MKSINSLIKWILFVPVTLATLVLSVLNGLYPNMVTAFLSTDQNGLAEIVAFAVLGLFAVCFVLSLFDRKTSPLHILRKNYFCLVISIMCAFGLAASAALDITNMVRVSEFGFMPVLVAVFTALAGVAMLFAGLNHLSGNNNKSNTSMLLLAMPLWCGVHLIDRFLGHTAKPVDAADTLDLVMFVALAMFFMYATMVHALIPAKNAVKSTVTFGLPATVITFVYGISQLFAVINVAGFNYVDIIPAASYILLGFYVLGFTAELSFKSKTVEEQRILEPQVDDDSDSVDDSQDEYGDSYDDEVQYSGASVSDEDADDSTDSADVADDDDNSDDTSEDFYDGVADYKPATPAAVRIAADEDDDADDSESEDTAEDLFRAAQQSDNKRTNGTSADVTTTGSDDMIIDGENQRPATASSAAPRRPKGPTTREAITYGDEDFILSVDAVDLAADTFDEDEDISAFILEPQAAPAPAPAPGGAKGSKSATPLTSDSYEDRLDEIDQLIISIQGGDSASSEE